MNLNEKPPLPNSYQPGQGSYPPNQPMPGQYPPNQPGQGTYPHNQPMLGQYPPNQPGQGTYPPNQSNPGQYPPNQPSPSQGFNQPGAIGSQPPVHYPQLPAYSAAPSAPSAAMAPPPNYFPNNTQPWQPNPIIDRPPLSGPAQSRDKHNQPKSKSTGLFSSIIKTVDAVSRDAFSYTDAYSGKNVMGFYIKTGNVIQLSTRPNGTTIQIVVAADGRLTVDCMGPNHPQATHAHWTVYVESAGTANSIVKLYNQNHFLSVTNDTVGLVQHGTPLSPDPKGSPLPTRFRVQQYDGQLSFESLFCPKMFLTHDEQKTRSLFVSDQSSFSKHTYFTISHSTQVIEQNPTKKRLTFQDRREMRREVIQQNREKMMQ